MESSTRFKVSLLALAIGLGLFALAGSAVGSTGSSAATGDTLKIDLNSDIDYTDPALAYYQPSWELEYATELKLMNYPDANGPKSSQLVPEAAAGLPTVSKGGRVYDFTVKPGFKFSNGAAVTAANFAAAFTRNADPKMQSPAGSFMSDIVGASAMLGGKASSISGIKVTGNHLIVTLSKAAPDFLARIAMPFFGAIPTNLPHDPNGVNEPPSAGPYYVASRTPNKAILLKRNTFYKGLRPHNYDAIAYTIGNSLEAIRLRVESGATDYAGDGVPPSSYAELAAKYGVNKGRLFVKPELVTNYLAMNTERPIFKDNPKLRQAVNFALDRKALLSQSGFLAGKRTDQILPAGMAGFRDADLYPLKGPNLTMAKKLASGNTRDGKVVLYEVNSGAGPLRAQIIQFDLKQIGIDVEIKSFTRAVQFAKEGTRGEPFDIADEAWAADYADPYDFVNVLLDGTTIHDSNNVNFSYFNDPVYNKKMKAASRLLGPARYKAYGTLDIDISRNAAPWAARANANDRVFVSSHVGCFTYSNVYTVNLAALCPK